MLACGSCRVWSDAPKPSPRRVSPRGCSNTRNTPGRGGAPDPGASPRFVEALFDRAAMRRHARQRQGQRGGLMNLLQQLEQEQVEKLAANRPVPKFQPGDTVRVGVKVVEGE